MNSRKGFGLMPEVYFNRSKFDLSHGLKTSMDVGKLYPIDVTEILPGDSFKVNTNFVSRVTSAFLKPVMDNLFLDIYSFFVPLRLVFDNAEKIFGNANPSQYAETDFANLPMNKQDFVVKSGDIGDYLGLPVNVEIPANSINVLPFRSFALIYDKWFRNQNVADEIYIYKGDALENFAVDGTEPFGPNNYVTMLPYVTKRKDYFTSALPSPQKGEPIQVPAVSGSLPVTITNTSPDGVGTKFYGQEYTPGHEADGHIVAVDGVLNFDGDSNGPLTLSPPIYGTASLDRDNLVFANVNDIRYAFSLQKMLERDALYGSRYNEYLLGHFGVVSPDSRLQIPEYLCGKRVPLNVQQVTQTSQGTEESPLANLGGYSLTNGHSYFNKSFTEHGYVVTVACIRQMHTYSQGMPLMFTRKNRNDFFDPLFSTIGEQPIYQREIYYNPADSTSQPSAVFGYKEPFSEYKVGQSRITGEMRPKVANSLDIWHFGDEYSNAPLLSENFINETSAFVDRTLAVPSQSQDNFILDFWFNMQAIRVMPANSLPGLIDHH